MDNAEIITIGSELLLPSAVEKNSSYITRTLFPLGIPVYFKTVVGDSEKEIANSIQTALKRVKWVILTGGLGPTEDDITKLAAARAFGYPLVLNKKILNQIKKGFIHRGRQFLKIHERLAWFPKNTTLIPNELGIAPGFILKAKKSFLVSLPGVPAEMRLMLQSTVSSLILKNRTGKNTLFLKRYKTFGITESEVNETLKDLMIKKERIFGLLAKGTGVEISLMLNGKNSTDIKKSLKEIELVIKNRLKDFIYGEDDETLEEVVGAQLKKGHKTLAVAESCTGGLISHRITNIPGSSSYFYGAVVSYSNLSKIKQLGVPSDLIKKHGAVSSKVAMAMAKGIRKISGSDIGIAVTGIAGPGGATANKPVGLVYFGLSDQKDLYWNETRYFVDRETFKLFAASKALDMVRRRLMKS